MARQDYYALLGVDRGATSAAIETAYRDACAVVQASADAHGADAANRLKFLRFAHETLLHEGRRAAYDASLIKPDVIAPAALPRQAQPFPPRLMYGGIGLLALLAAGAWFAKSPPPAQPTPLLVQAASVVYEAAPGAEPAVALDAAPSAEQRAAPVAEGAQRLSAEELFERNAQSVVVVVGLNGADKPILQGSGVVVEDERVITNCHVAKAAASTQVKHGETHYPATMVRADADPEHDLCLLYVSGLRAPAVPLAAIESLRVGQKVFALGAPRGLELTLSEGIVSSLRKHGDSHFIQTTASISSGSSGGGLFNDKGELVGITTFQSIEGQNLNFAVPVDWVAKLLGPRDSFSGPSPSALRELPGQ